MPITAESTSPTLPSARPGRPGVERWVRELQALTGAAAVQWCDGSAAQSAGFLDAMREAGTVVALNEELRPGSYLARSTPDDVARVEDRTFICSTSEEEAGPTNNWRAPDEMRKDLAQHLRGAMLGRTMYVLPFSMGAVGGPLSRIGVQVTDSPYAAYSMVVMTRTSQDVLTQLDAAGHWVPAVHSVGCPLIDDHGRSIPDQPWPSNATKVIAHFPETGEIWSFGSGYGGNALLAKKCFALRIASVLGRSEGWLAEHMVLIRVTDPEGAVFHFAGAFPSACGKTNFAMMEPTLPGWRVETIGDDIAWLVPGADGRLRAINPEAGFFGVAPGVSPTTSPAIINMVARDTLFTNTALTEEGDVWWEGLSAPPEGLTDWQGRGWTSDSREPAAHPNARFTVAADRCPTLADDWSNPEGVAVDAIIFGGRRASTVPLVTEAADWVDGVFMGATIASEQTAAAEGAVGRLRFDPFAMLPFCGYNMADHWQHWLDVGERLGSAAPAVFRVNWFRKDDDGRYIWPGFGDNIRVLSWITRRLQHRVGVGSTPIGGMPRRHELELQGLHLEDADLRALLTVSPAAWERETVSIHALFERFGDRVPAPLQRRLGRLERALGAFPAAQ